MSDNTPAVSIVFPVYNAIPFLEQAVASIFSQTLTDWELIAVDDASTDGSWQFLQRIADPRVRIVRNEHNCGTPITSNRAIDMARGKWIAKMDADDIILPRRLELQVQALEADPHIDLLGTGSFVVDRDLNPVEVRRPPTRHAEIVGRPTINFPLTFGALMGKAGWWRRWRNDPRVGAAGHEFDLYFRSHRESLFSNVPEPLYVYRYVGHTRTWRKMTIGAFNRFMTLLRNGFRMGMPLTTLLGLATMVPRPLLYAIKLAIGSRTALAGGSTPLSEDDRRILKEVSQVELPLKRW